MAEEKHTPTNEHGYETTDAAIGKVVIYSVALVVFVALVFGAILLLFNFLAVQTAQEAAPPPPLLQEAELLPPQPRLQRVPAGDLRRMKAVDETVLNSYGWVDKENGVVRIPIDQAMELTLERGLPVREEAAQE